jgi:histidine ammonia-lyase
VLGVGRALRLSGSELPDAPVAAAFERAVQRLPLVEADHPLSDEVAQAEHLVDVLSTF